MPGWNTSKIGVRTWRESLRKGRTNQCVFGKGRSFARLFVDFKDWDGDVLERYRHKDSIIIHSIIVLLHGIDEGLKFNSFLYLSIWGSPKYVMSIHHPSTDALAAHKFHLMPKWYCFRSRLEPRINVSLPLNLLVTAFPYCYL